MLLNTLNISKKKKKKRDLITSSKREENYFKCYDTTKLPNKCIYIVFN